MSSKSIVLLNSGLYTFSSLLTRAIGFLLLPVYTFFLKPEDYGITNLVNSFNGVATFIVAFSLYSAVVRLYADYKEDRERLKRFYGTIVIFVFFSGCLFVTLGFILQKFLIAWFFEGITFHPYVVIALFTLIFNSLFTVHQSIMQGMQAGKKLTIRNLAVFFIQTGLTLLFIGVFKMGATGVLLAMLILNAGYSIYMVIDLRANDLITFCIDKTLLRGALAYSIPIMPHNLSTHIASFASRVFINNSGNLSAVGFYSVAMQFSNVIDTVQTSVNRAFAPWFFDLMNHGDEVARRDIVELSRFLLILYSLIYMGIGLFSQEVIILMTTERYIKSWTVVPILVVAYSVKSIYYFYVSVLFYYVEAAKKIFIATIIGSLADITFASLLVPLYGMYGAALSFLNAKIVIVVIVVLISKKYNNVGYKVAEMLKIIVPSLMFMGLGLYLSYTKYTTVFSWVNLFYKFAILFVYLTFLYFTNRKIISKFVSSDRIKCVLNRGKGIHGIN